MRLPKPEKPIPIEVQLEKLRDQMVSERINLYLDLKKILGDEKGTDIFKKLYDEGMKRIRKNFPGGKLPVGELMKRELVSFPVLPGTNSYVELQNMMALLYFDNGDFDMAATIAKEVMRQSKSNRDARFMLCKINLIQGDLYRVIGELRLLIRENPNIAEFHYCLGLVHEIRDETILAEQEFRDALNISSNYRDALKKWLAVYPMQGALSEVENRISQYLKSNPTDQDIIVLRDEILKKKEGILTSLNLTPRQKTLSLPGLP